MTDEEQQPAETLAFPNPDDVKIKAGMDLYEAFRVTRHSVLQGIKYYEEHNQHHQIPGLIAKYNAAAKEHGGPMMEPYVMPRNPRKK